MAGRTGGRGAHLCRVIFGSIASWAMRSSGATDASGLKSETNSAAASGPRLSTESKKPEIVNRGERLGGRRARRAHPQAVDELVPPMLGVQEVLVLEPRGQWCLLLRRHWHGFRAGTSGLQPERSQLSLKLMGLIDLIDLRRSNNRSIRHCREQLQTPSTRLPWQRASTTAGSPLQARPFISPTLNEAERQFAAKVFGAVAWRSTARSPTAQGSADARAEARHEKAVARLRADAVHMRSQAEWARNHPPEPEPEPEPEPAQGQGPLEPQPELKLIRRRLPRPNNGSIVGSLCTPRTEATTPGVQSSAPCSIWSGISDSG